MSVLTNGLRILSVAQEWQIVVTGIIIILAVYADMLRTQARLRAHEVLRGLPPKDRRRPRNRGGSTGTTCDPVQSGGEKQC